MTPSRLVLVFALAFCTASSWGQHIESTNNSDPWEPMNRKLFFFNEKLDQLLLKPVARGYHFVMPDAAERGVANFIANIYEVNSVLNNVLQGKFRKAGYSGGRFLVNSTLGVAGLFDVATGMGIERHTADFGQTLAAWGFGSGPFVMVPLIGPRTVRSGVGYVVDTYTSIPALIDETQAAYTFWTVEIIDYRARLLDAEDLVTGDRYIFVRDAYLQRRNFFVSGGVVDDSFSDFEQDENFEEF